MELIFCFIRMLRLAHHQLNRAMSKLQFTMKLSILMLENIWLNNWATFITLLKTSLALISFLMVTQLKMAMYTNVPKVLLSASATNFRFVYCISNDLHYIN